MESYFLDNASTDCENNEDNFFPVDAILGILQMKVQDDVSQTSDSEKATKKKNQSQFKNMYSLVVAQAHSLLKHLVLSLSQDDKRKVEKEYTKSEEKWKLDIQNLNLMLAEFESVDERYSKVKKEVQNWSKTKQDTEKLEELKIEKESLYCKRQEIQKVLLDNLYHKRFAFMVPILRLIDGCEKPFLTRDRIRNFIGDKNNSCSKSRALTTLSLYLQNDLKVGLLIVHIVLALLSPSEESKESPTIFKKSDIAFRYWMIKSAMTTKNKTLLYDQKKRSHIYQVFDRVSTNLQEKLSQDLNEEHLRCLEEISGKYHRTLVFNLNGKRPFDDDHVEYPINKYVKKV